MKKEIRRILARQADNISFEEKNGNILVNLDCYALSGYAAKEIADFARENDRTCVFTIQDINNPHLQIIL